MIPWRDWLRFAVEALHLAPPAFWTLTLAEWRWLTETAGSAPMTPACLDALLALYPEDRP